MIRAATLRTMRVVPDQAVGNVDAPDEACIFIAAF